MKVKDLIKELEKCDQDSYVIVQEYDGGDDIGNGKDAGSIPAPASI
jgi:hypothetical protein